MNNSLKRLCTEANKTRKVVHKGSSKTKEYFMVDDYDVTVTIEKVSSVPYSKMFECTCAHASLFGTEHNIPCKHIFALISWLVRNGENMR